MNHITSRLAARGGIRQVEASLRADEAAAAVDRAVLRVWRELLRLLRQEPHWALAHEHASRIAALLPLFLRHSIQMSLGRMARWGWQTAVAAVTDTVPVKALAVAVVQKLTEGNHARSLSVLGGGRAGVDEQLRRNLLSLLEDAAILEDEPAANVVIVDLLRGLLQGVPRGGGKEPAFASTLSMLSKALFLAPTELEIASVVFSGDWQARLAAGTRLAAPQVLAQAVAGGLARGQSQQEIARELTPLVQGVRASARRIARTESLRVAGEMQMRCHDQLGDLVVGYQLHATLDQHSRPWHAHRNGQIYYLEPKPGQKGPAQMPHPPDEPEDPRERPAGTPATAWNCR